MSVLLYPNGFTIFLN